MRTRTLTLLALALALTACGGGGDTPATHTVSGAITPTAAGAGATVTLGDKTATASSSGSFSFSGVADGTYTVMPTKAGVTFTPASRSVTVSGDDVSDVDFTAQGGSGTAKISGTVRAAGGQLVDSDTGDVNAPSEANDTPATAQAIPSAVTLGGHASAADDPFDAFRGNFAAGETVNLAIADPAGGANDLDLYLYDVSDTTNPVATSLGTGGIETLSIPSGGEFFIAIKAETGGSNYVLNVGAGPPAPDMADTLRLDGEFVPGEVIVRFDESAIGPAGRQGDELSARASALGLVPLAGATRGRPALLGLGTTARARATALATLGVDARMAGPFGASLDPVAAAKRETLLAVKALRARADIRTADPNYIHHPSAVPNDKLYAYQWHYPLINLPQAWDVTTGTPANGSIVVAVIDTGVFLAHPDLTGQLLPGYDFISNPTMSRDGDGIDANADDPGDAAAAGSSSWHGTHVAGTIAARSNDDFGAAGVSWGAKIMPVRVLGAGGGSSYDIIQGVRFAAGLSNDSGTLPPQPADVANLSLGCQNCFSQTEQNAFTEARATEMIIVAAAGNANSTDPSFPASYDGVISVSAVDMSRNRAPYSNSGPNVDIAAPGGDTSVDSDGNGYSDGVLSSLVDDSGGTREANWVFYQGTSMAAPHIAGVIALMKAVCPSLTPAQVDTLIASGQMTTDRGAPGRDDVFGYGLVDAFGAVQAAQTQCGATPATGLDINPSRLDIGATSTSVSLTASKQGTGPLTIMSVTEDAPWLTLAPGAVDADGLGPYTATVSRAGLAIGRYSTTVTFALQGGGQVVVPVSMQVGTMPTVGDAGYVYVLLVDSTLHTVAQVHGSTAAGLSFQFTDVPAGQYLIVAGTDSDNDDVVCDAGEACGAYPTLGAPTPLTVGTEDVTGVDFVAGFGVTLGADAASAPARGGYRRLPDTKSVAR